MDETYFDSHPSSDDSDYDLHVSYWHRGNRSHSRACVAPIHPDPDVVCLPEPSPMGRCEPIDCIPIHWHPVCCPPVNHCPPIHCVPQFECDGSFDIMKGGIGCPTGVYICIRRGNELYSISVSISSPQNTFTGMAPISLVYTVTNTGNVPLPVGTSFLFQHNRVNSALQRVLAVALEPGMATSYVDTYNPTPTDATLGFMRFTLQGWATLQFNLPWVTTASVYDVDQSGISIIRVP
jgi:hypothetical protein